VLLVEGDQVQGKLGSSSSLLVLEFDLQGAWILFTLESNRIGGVSELHDFRKVGNIDTKDNVAITLPTFLKS
jgi:hypothetical protein